MSGLRGHFDDFDLRIRRVRDGDMAVMAEVCWDGRLGTRCVVKMAVL